MVLLLEEELRKGSHQGFLSKHLTGSEVRTTLSGNVWDAVRFLNASHRLAGSQPNIDLTRALFGLRVVF